MKVCMAICEVNQGWQGKCIRLVRRVTCAGIAVLMLAAIIHGARGADDTDDPYSLSESPIEFELLSGYPEGGALESIIPLSDGGEDEYLYYVNEFYVTSPESNATVVCVGTEVTVHAIGHCRLPDAPSDDALITIWWDQSTNSIASGYGTATASRTLNAPGQYEFTAASNDGYKTITVTAIKIEIKGEAGADAPEYICASGSTNYVAVITPSVTGTYQWSSTSSKLDLSNTNSPTVTAAGAGEASDDVDDEELTVNFTPTGRTTSCSESTELTVAMVEIEVVSDCQVPPLEGLVSSFPHDYLWKPFNFVEPPIPDYISKDNPVLVKVTLIPTSAGPMEYSLKRVWPTHSHAIDNAPKSGGEYQYEIVGANPDLEVIWGPCDDSIGVHNSSGILQLPFYGLFQPNELDHYIDEIPLLDKVIQIEAAIDNGISSVASSLGLSSGVVPSVTFGVEAHLRNVLESFYLGVTRMHEVWMLDCCKKAEKDLRRIEFAFGDTWGIGQGENTLAAAIAAKIYSITIPSSWTNFLEGTYGEIPGFTGGVKPADVLRNSLTNALSGVIGDNYEANASIDVSNVIRQLDFCAERGYPKSVANWETLGSATIMGDAKATGTINSTKNMINSELYDFVANHFGLEDWGWGQIAVLPFDIKAEASWRGYSEGAYYGDAPRVYRKNMHEIDANVGARIALAIQSLDGTAMQLYGWQVDSWSPFSVSPLTDISDFEYPLLLEEEAEVQIAKWDHEFDPCD